MAMTRGYDNLLKQLELVKEIQIEDQREAFLEALEAIVKLVDASIEYQKSKDVLTETDYLGEFTHDLSLHFYGSEDIKENEKRLMEVKELLLALQSKENAEIAKPEVEE
jgi:hypothetical protein